MTILYEAYDAAKLLLDCGADMKAVSPTEGHVQRSALGRAVALGKGRMVRLLLDKSPDISEEYVGSTVLNVALRNSRHDMVRLLFQHYPSLFNKPSVINGLDMERMSPISVAATFSLQCVHELRTLHASIDLRCGDENEAQPALGVAIERGRYDIAAYLLQNGANPYCRGLPKRKFWTILNEVILADRESDGRPKSADSDFPNFFHMAKPWVHKHKLLNVSDFAGRSILHFAICNGHVVAAKTLVAASVYYTVFAGNI
ncbi:ankyrin repeat-containing domain protein [Lasiosphaeria hispida]|uniref:Ankyrin repeat-containing domain protein n=1 Tax=Lasiosphaeria hispida TaxID=260671 RepID=A0AAJ0H595_9PEZI|nr:ankyrin repeat-containing domain protein [Lasiosphaeria hispida]